MMGKVASEKGKQPAHWLLPPGHLQGLRYHIKVPALGSGERRQIKPFSNAYLLEPTQ
jgi:hypothetical protein